MRRIHIAFPLAIVIALIVSPLWAQFRIRGRSELAAARPSVYVRDSAVAAEKLALAQRMERLKEWNKSADVYQEIIEKYADRVVPAEDAPPAEAPGVVQRYSSVTLKVQSLLGKWPAEGLAVYRARYETPAATLLEQADPDDIGALSRVVQRYFPTDAAKNAALRLMELYIEDGEFSAAAWLGERLLDAHPGLAADEATVLFRTALAQHMAWQAEPAKATAGELKRKHPDAKGVVLGNETLLVDALARMMNDKPPVAHGSASDSWPMFGGDWSRGRVPASAGKPGAKIAEISLSRLKPRIQNNPELRAQIENLQKQRREYGLSLGIMPVVDRGELFYQDNTRIYGVSVDTGYTLPGWAMVYGTDNNNPPREMPGQPTLTNIAQLSVTVTDTSVLAVLNQSDRMLVVNDFGGMVQSDRDTPLVCVDRATGAKRWSTSPLQFPESLANLKSLKMNGSPLVVGDNVYIAARGGKQMQFEDAYVLCFALADGRLRWACYLASGNAPDPNFSGMMAGSEAVSHLAYAGGRIYAVTNLGAVAAVDAYTGTIAWLSLYPKQPGNAIIFDRQGGNPLVRMRKPWAQNPAIVKDGKVFALPNDSSNVLIYDAASGEEVKRIAMSDFESASTMLAVLGEKLVVANPNKVYCINWPQYASDKAEDSLFWVSQVGVTGMTDEQSRDIIRGRPFVTQDSVFVPTKSALKRISLNRGMIEETYPRNDTWPGGEGPGNVVVTQDQVIIAGADSIVVYSDLALARAKLDKAIADAPNDAMPRLKYAETLFAAGEVDPAIGKLDEAIAALGGMNSMRPGNERDRVFVRAMTFAEKVPDRATDSTRVAGLYDRAATAASTTAQQVAWRLSRAKWENLQQNFPSEVRLYQEILSDPKMRIVNVPAEDGSGAVMASSIAESTIKARLRHAPDAYAPFDNAARDAFAAAKAANDPTQILAVAQAYPNAKVAIEAMFAAADAYEAAGKHRPAAQVLNQLYRKYRDSGADKARILEAQARNYLALPGGIAIAIGRLNEGGNLGTPLLSRPLKLPDGETLEGVTFRAAAELLQKYSDDLATATLPDFKLPIQKKVTKAFLPETTDMVIPDVDRLVLPPRELRKFARYDRVVTWTGEKGVGIYAIGTNKPLGTSSAIMQDPRGGVWLSNDLLVWTPQKISLLRGDGGATAWEVTLANLPAADLAAAENENQPVPVGQQQPQQRGVVIGPGAIIIDNQVVRLRNGQVLAPNGMPIVANVRRPQPAGGEQIEHVRPVGDRVLITTTNGRLAAIELSNGQLAWQTRVTDSSIPQVVTSDDFVAARLADGAGAQIVALETFTGQVVWRRAFSQENNQVPINMTFSPDGTLLFTLPDRVCGIDLYEPGKGLKFGDGAQAQGAQIFTGAEGPEHLVVADGRILAVSEGGQFIRVLSLDEGKEVPRMPTLSTGGNTFHVSIRVVGPRVYVINQKTVLGYSLDRPDDNWTGSGIFEPQHTSANIRDAFIGKKHVVLLAQPTDAGMEPPNVSTNFTLIAYARYPGLPGATAESHKIDQMPAIQHPAGIEHDQWQPVEGGFYFRSIDRQAHLRKGAEAP